MGLPGSTRVQQEFVRAVNERLRLEPRDGERKMIPWSGSGSGSGSGRSITKLKCSLVGIGALLMLLLAGCQSPVTESGGGEESSVGEGRSPLETVNLRMQAYNDHDLDVFLSTYAEDVEIFTYPDRSLGKGKKRIKNLFEEMFQEASLRVDIHHQIAKDSYVINHETVVSGDETTEYVSIYEVRKGRIQSVRFVRD